MAETIEHTGVVERIDLGVIFVRIEQQSACAACHANGACSAADIADKVIEVVDNGGYMLGQKVMITGAMGVGLKAVLFAFIFPFISMIITLIVSLQYTTELYSGLLALAALVPYYAVLSLFRKKLKKSFTFEIKPM